MIYNLFISPIELIVDWIFQYMYRQFPFIGVLGAIIGVSLVINFLALPIYNVADGIQDKERQLQRKMQSGIKRIKETFHGDERFMMLQTFYKQNHYHPALALRSSLSILIEIPFFIAAYHYLSNCEILKETLIAITLPPHHLNV